LNGGVDTLAVTDPTALDRVVATLLAGEAVVVPTETVYGVATLPAHQPLLLELKGRPESVPISVLVADAVQAEVATGVALNHVAGALATAYWPGPLTLVLPTAAGPTLGVRCPDHGFMRAVAAAVGPVATTSANRHGEPTPPTAAEAAAALSEPGPALVIDGGTISGLASTVVDATGDRPVVLREGPIQSADIEAAVP
jgi:L-threonylcarbamoyladenylate synthase